MHVAGHHCMRPTSGSNRLVTYTQQFSGNSPKKVELYLPQEASVSPPTRHYKPKPPLGGTTLTRNSRLHNKDQLLCGDSPKCFTQVFDANSLINQQNGVKTDLNKKQKSKRRVQSAKPRLTSEAVTYQDDDTCIFAKAQKCKGKRPVSAVELRGGHQWNYSYSGPVKTSTSDHNLNITSTDDKNKGLEPCVFGYKTQSWVHGRPPDVPAGNAQDCKTKSDGGTEIGQGRVWSHAQSFLADDNVSLSDLIDFDDIDEEDLEANENNPVPNTLRPLLAWATPQVSKDIIGIDPSKCLIFLPSMQSMTEALPCVPPPLKAGDELPYIEKILPPEEPKKPKKYDHPWTKLPIDEHVCNHRVRNLDISETAVETPRQIKVYATDGRLLHQSCNGSRTEEAVRKEIQELEDLMQGIGTLNGCSIVVQYQAEINRLHNMVNRTMGRVKEIEMREEEKRRLAQPPDYFGLRDFYQNHDEVMSQLRQQHMLCMQELASLTGDLDMNTARQHFQDRLTLSESDIN